MVQEIRITNTLFCLFDLLLQVYMYLTTFNNILYQVMSG
jgi:hypothetical protein